MSKPTIHKFVYVFLTPDGLAESTVRVELQHTTRDEAPDYALKKMAELDDGECEYTVLAVYACHTPLLPLDDGARGQEA